MPKTIMALLMLVVFIPAAPAHAMRAIGFAEYRLPAEGAIALPVTEDGTLSGVAAAVDEETGGSLQLALSEAKFTGKVGETLTLFGNILQTGKTESRTHPQVKSGRNPCVFQPYFAKHTPDLCRKRWALLLHWKRQRVVN